MMLLLRSFLFATIWSAICFGFTGQTGALAATQPAPTPSQVQVYTRFRTINSVPSATRTEPIVMVIKRLVINRPFDVLGVYRLA
jgi:hypothetical protein